MDEKEDAVRALSPKVDITYDLDRGDTLEKSRLPLVVRAESKLSRHPLSFMHRWLDRTKVQYTASVILINLQP